MYAHKRSLLKQLSVEKVLSQDRQMATTDVQIIWLWRMLSLDDSLGHCD